MKWQRCGGHDSSKYATATYILPLYAACAIGNGTPPIVKKLLVTFSSHI